MVWLFDAGEFLPNLQGASTRSKQEPHSTNSDGQETSFIFPLFHFLSESPFCGVSGQLIPSNQQVHFSWGWPNFLRTGESFHSSKTLIKGICRSSTWSLPKMFPYGCLHDPIKPGCSLPYLHSWGPRKCLSFGTTLGHRNLCEAICDPIYLALTYCSCCCFYGHLPRM